MSLGETVLKPSVVAILGAALVVGGGIGVGGTAFYDYASWKNSDASTCARFWNNLYKNSFEPNKFAVSVYAEEVEKLKNSELIGIELNGKDGQEKRIACLNIANRLLVIRIDDLKKTPGDHKEAIEEAKEQIKANKAEIKELEKGTPEKAPDETNDEAKKKEDALNAVKAAAAKLEEVNEGSDQSAKDEAQKALDDAKAAAKVAGATDEEIDAVAKVQQSQNS